MLTHCNLDSRHQPTYASRARSLRLSLSLNLTATHPQAPGATSPQTARLTLHQQGTNLPAYLRIAQRTNGHPTVPPEGSHPGFHCHSPQAGCENWGACKFSP